MFTHFRNVSVHCLSPMSLIQGVICILCILLIQGTLFAVECEDNEPLYKQYKILEVLFGLEKGTAKDQTNYDYNYYGCNPETLLPNGDRAYDGSHAGWDVQTQDKSKNRKFYSLTNGIVIMDGLGNKRPGDIDTYDERTFNTVAVYDPDNNRTTFYLHASEISPKIIKGIEINNENRSLGKQGDTGVRGSVHVHLEVQRGEATRSSKGTNDDGTDTINPIPYLYDSVQPPIEKKEPTIFGWIKDLFWW